MLCSLSDDCMGLVVKGSYINAHLIRTSTVMKTCLILPWEIDCRTLQAVVVHLRQQPAETWMGV